MSHYHIPCATPEEAVEVSARRNDGYLHEAYRPEHHKAHCPHAAEGWFAVYRNEQGNMWNDAPWEKCWPCRRQEETAHYTLRDVKGKRLDVHLRTDDTIVFTQDPSYNGPLTFAVADIRQMFSEILLETE